jgi:hypothetical protein
MEEEIRKIPRVLQHSGGCRRITPWPLECTTSASACLLPFDLMKQFVNDIAELLRLARRERCQQHPLESPSLVRVNVTKPFFAGSTCLLNELGTCCWFEYI